MKRKLNAEGKALVIAVIIIGIIMMCFEKTCMLGALLLIAFYIWCKGGIMAVLDEWAAEEDFEPAEEEPVVAEKKKS